ncbi:hypothetical protein MXM36_14705 [Enterococcus gallinarum]|uniref:hypothetical protein n=1 Tax=Enterococcus gallinarum TaxID=1353 RepID=UPI002DBA377C|nr:hypothetical protein [Enterococcus gallinarum]MEB5857931.1 hypothetical protein [Enterococcus gallinarum]
MSFEIVEIKKHKREFGEFDIEHSADVKISGTFEKNRDLIAEVSTKVGYHAAGYGLYHFGLEKIDKNEFHLEWETNASCD